MARMKGELARRAQERRAALDAEGRASEEAQRRAVNHFIQLGLPIYCGGGHRNFVALTFDDGPGEQSEQIFDLLRQTSGRSTFFQIGEHVPERTQVTRDAAKLGEVANHTYDHSNLTQLSRADARAQLSRTKTAIEQATGERVRLFRAPYGAHTPEVDAIGKRLGMLHVLWDVDSQDGVRAGKDKIERNVLDGLRPGNIILMHEIHATTRAAMPRILAEIEARKLIPVTVPELLALDPPSDEQVRAGFAGCERLLSGGDGENTVGSAPR
jgi:peptidoglycan/xylan/chitin deacetylase (PgdA/CDA1 family)